MAVKVSEAGQQGRGAACDTPRAICAKPDSLIGKEIRWGGGRTCWTFDNCWLVWICSNPLPLQLHVWCHVDFFPASLFLVAERFVCLCSITSAILFVIVAGLKWITAADRLLGQLIWLLFLRPLAKVSFWSLSNDGPTLLSEVSLWNL